MGFGGVDPDPEVVGAFGRPVENPFRIQGGHVDTAVTVLIAIAVMPESAMQGDLVEAVKVHDVGDIFDIVVIYFPLGPGHLILEIAAPNLENPFAGGPAVEAAGNQAGVNHTVALIGGKSLFV